MKAAAVSHFSAPLICAIPLLGSSCASITGSEFQNLAISAKTEQGAKLDKVACELKNDKGQWKTVAPGFVGVQRSSEDLLVTCAKEGHKDGFLRTISRASGSMFGNIIFGGGIGALIDHNKGTGYDYPDTIVVEMGRSIVRDKNDERDEEKHKAARPGTAPEPSRPK
jgi:hypothetical protein